MRTVYLNGAYVPEAQANISIFDRGVLFADAVYEVVTVLDGRLIDMPRHFARLERSLGELAISASADWTQLCLDLAAKNTLGEGIIYIQVSRGAADRDFLFPAEGTTATIFAFTQVKPVIDSPLVARGLDVVLRRDLRWRRRDIKTTQLLYASLAKMEAKAAGADDAWLVEDGVITEGTSQNAHMVTREGVILTHPLDHDILHGVTRLSVIALAEKLGINVEERAFTPEELAEASEAFVTSATLFVAPVVSVDGHPVGDGKPGPIARKLREAYIVAARDGAL